jgi:hypothetical protein
MTKIEKIIRQVSDLREFYIKLKISPAKKKNETSKKRKVKNHARLGDNN